MTYPAVHSVASLPGCVILLPRLLFTHAGHLVLESFHLIVERFNFLAKFEEVEVVLEDLLLALPAFHGAVSDKDEW